MLQPLFTFILCIALCDAFPQRNKPNPESTFDLDAYWTHFTPPKQAVRDHPSFIPNQDYRYIPLLGERPDYVPPLVFRGQHPQPKPIDKHRSWHSTYRNSNFPTRLPLGNKNIHHKKPDLNHGRELQKPVEEFELPSSNFVHIHTKMEDLGDYEAPVVVEAVERRNPVFNLPVEDYDVPEILEVVVKKTTSGNHGQRHEVSKRPLKETEPEKKFNSEPILKEPSLDEDFEAPVVVEADLKVENTKGKNSDHEKTKVHHSSGDQEVPIIVEAKTNVDHTNRNKNEFPKIKPNDNMPDHSVKTKNPVMPIDIVSPIYDYEAPTMVETSPKKPNKNLVKTTIGTYYKKPVSLIKEIESMDYESPIVEDYIMENTQAKNPVKKPNKQLPLEDLKYSFVEQGINSKEYQHSSAMEPSIKLPVFTHDKKNTRVSIKVKPAVKTEASKIDYSPQMLIPSYDDYESPIIVESPVEEKVTQKEVKKIESLKPIQPKENEHKIESVEYNTGEDDDYKDLRSSHEDYETPVSISDEASEDSDYYNFDYDYLTDEYPEEHIDTAMEDKTSSLKTNIQSPQKTKPTTNLAGGNKENDDNFVTDPAQDKKKIESYKETNASVKENKKRIKRRAPIDYEDYELPTVLEAIVKRDPEEQRVKHPSKLLTPESELDYEAPVVVEAVVKREHSGVSEHGHIKLVESGNSINMDGHMAKGTKESLGGTSHKPTFVEISPNEDYELPVVVDSITKEIGPRPSDYLPTNPQYSSDYEAPIVVEALSKVGSSSDTVHRPIVKPHIRGERPIKAYADTNTRSKRVPVHPTRQDAYERPIDQVYERNEYQNPNNYFEDGESIRRKNPSERNFGNVEVPDGQIILDSITINKEGPEGREIPFLEVLAVDDKADSGHDGGLKVIAVNKENGEVDVINVGHENSNHESDRFEDSGSGEAIVERSLDPRGFLPLDSWSFMGHIQAQERRKFKRCITPRNETGSCMPVQMCPVPNIGNTVEQLLKNVCIIDDVFIGICCPEFPVETVSVDWGSLGRPDTEPLIENVEESLGAQECGKLPSMPGNKDSWPWMAALVSTTSDRVFCGGALISEFYVLTAAHCTSRIPRNQILVRLGSSDSHQAPSEFAVVEIKRHAQYNPRTMQNDIALLKLSTRVNLGKFRRIVCLPSNDVHNVGETAVLLRWKGTVERSSAESLVVLSNHHCQNRLGSLIGSSVLCTETRNDEATCNADSGAPLVLEKDGSFQIIGTLTWSRNGCEGNFPTVFTRISSYQKWIETHTK